MKMPQDKWISAKKDATEAMTPAKPMTPDNPMGQEKDGSMMKMMSSMNAKMDKMMSMMQGKGM